jgi:hypothetical protein
MPKVPAAPDFDSQTTSLGQLLSDGHVIEAPGYQRPYSWRPDHAGKLLEDIRDAMEPADPTQSRRACFLSFMVFVDRRAAVTSLFPAWSRTKSERQLEVVDGFQRLTTLTMLLCLLRDIDAATAPANERLLSAISAGRGANARARVSLRGQDETFFHEHVRSPGASLQHSERDHRSPPEECILAARDHLREILLNLEPAERLRLADFLLDACFIVLVSSSDIDRAHHLFMILNATGKQLASKDILKADLLGKVPAHLSSVALAHWGEAETRAGSDFESVFSHIRVMYGRPKGDVITGIRAIAAQSGADAFITTVLRPVTEAFDEVRAAQHSGSAQSAEINLLLTYLSWIPFADWKPPTLLWWQQTRGDPAALLSYLKKLDRLALGVRLLGIGGGKREGRFGAVVSAIRKGGNLFAEGGPLDLTREELRNIQYHLRTLPARNSPAAKLLMMRLTDALAGRPESLSFPKPMTVEHVLPKTLGANNQWRDDFPDMAEREQCTESLGNLVLVTKGQNDRARNYSFVRKREVYFKTVGAPLPAINEGLRDKDEWKAADIRAREIELNALIDKCWDFRLTAARQDQAAAAPARRARKTKRA